MTIDSCYEGIVRDLTAQKEIEHISKKLIACTNNTERVLLVIEVIQKLNAFPNISHVEKSINAATAYKDLGNMEFQKRKDDHAALQYYNLSLLHAPKSSDSYAIAIANRSAVLYHLKRYKDCLLDIDKVFQLQYPEKLREKLMKRKELCLNLLNEPQDQDESPLDEVSLGSRHTQYLCASSKIDVVNTKEMGRHVKANADIEVGEVIACEEPYFTLLLKSQILYTCSYCMSRSAHLLPCDTCCFALYCSDQCKNEAWKDYHAIECPLMPTFIDLEFTKLELLALRVVIKARCDHDSWTELFQTIKEAEDNIDTEKHGLVREGNQWVYDSKYYTPIHCLATNIDKRTISDIFQKSVTAAVLLQLLKMKTNFMKAATGESDNDIMRCVAGLLLRHGMTSPTNMHNISSITENADGNFEEEVSLGSAPYAFLSLINHSCAPNVVRSSKLETGKTILFALRPIKKGMQLFDNYGSHHALESRVERQHQLKFQYRFVCTCEACTGDWPTYLRLRPAPAPAQLLKKKKALLSDQAIQNLQKGDKSFANEVFKPLCELAALFEPYAPCVELADCQEALKQCLSIFGGLIPHGYSRVIEWPAIPSVI